MAKKGKKNKKSNSGGGSSNSAPKKLVSSLPQEQVQKIEEFDEQELNRIEALNEIADDELKETSEDAQRLTEIRESGNVESYIRMLHEKLLRINAIEAKAKELRDKNSEAQKEIEAEKRKLEAERKDTENELAQIRKGLNDREKKLNEEQLAIDNGEYSTIIQSLLQTLRKTEEDITSSTRSLVEDLGRKHSTYLSDLAELQAKKEEIENRSIELDKLQQEIELERNRLSRTKENFERKTRSEVQDEYQDQIEDLEFEVDRVKRERDRLQQQVNEASEFKRKFNSVFTSSTADVVLAEQQQLQSRCSELQRELNERPSKSEYDLALTTIDELQKKIQELESKVNEERLSELRLSLHNSDAYILEINTYKAKIDSLEARERSLTRTIEDLHETIKQLKDEEKAKEAAFEQARRMDNTPELQERKFRARNPSSLKFFVEYLQAFMASKKSEPFFYDRKTIRIFLAGLNMSPLTILQGISGTGKTSLPREIAKAMVAAADGYTDSDDAGNRNEPYRICAIQSGWRDNMDLMGFYNNFEKKYKETDFFKAIYLAAQPKYKDTLFFIILDEMNLSHPEHYFADFLSLMEQSVEDRYVKVNADEELLPKRIRERQMLLPPNVRFIGTANHDETTLDFAPKTYDRSNVITLDTTPRQNTKPIQERFAVSYSWLQEQFIEAESRYVQAYERFKRFISNKKFREQLNDRGIGIGNRFDKQAKKFICAYMAMSQANDEALAEAVDHLITSRLFRSLKNRYDLSADNLSEFKDDYGILFLETFGKDPEAGLKLLTSEIEKKR